MKKITLERITSPNAYLRNLINRAFSPSAWRLIPLLAVCLALMPIAQAAPAPETPDPGAVGGPFSTADGTFALANNTGAANSAFGWWALFSNIDAGFSTAVGAGALLSNNGANNTAVGAVALFLTSDGTDNVAVGTASLLNNADGSFNNAIGSSALNLNVSGFFNNAHGRSALLNNTSSENNAMGDLAMENVTTGTSNTAVGDDAGRFLVDGSGNVCVGDEAGTGLGASVNNCIAIGAPGAGPFATLDNTCFIGSIFGENVSDPGTQAAVFVDQFNVVGIFNSSRKYKHDIQPMDKTSETLYQLKPVTFKFNSDWKGTTQYGLIAEEVADVDPQLVVRRDGETVTVRYEQVNAMLLNEFLKEHRTVQELKKQVAALTEGLQRVSAQLEVIHAKSQTVLNNQ
jgi:hypothetical protein